MTSKQEAAAAVLMPRTRAVHSFRLKLRWSVRLRRHVHIPANTTAGRHMCTIALIFTPAGLHAHTTKVHKVLGARIYHGRMAYVAPPTAGPPLAPMTNIFFRRQDRNHPEKQRRHARDDTNALPSLGHQDRARVRPDQDRRPPARQRQPGLRQRARARP